MEIENLIICMMVGHQWNARDVSDVLQRAAFRNAQEAKDRHCGRCGKIEIN